MLKITTILALILLGSSSLAISAPQEKPANHHKHHAHRKKITGPVKNEEWYLNQARESQRFKAIALESDSADFLPENMMLDHLMQQVPHSNHPVDESNKNSNGAFKNNSTLANPNEITILFVPVIPNNKLIDLQNRPDLHPTLMLLWKE